MGRWGQFGGHVSFYLTASGGGEVTAGGAPQASQVCRRGTGPSADQACSLWLQNLPSRADPIAASSFVGHISPCLHLWLHVLCCLSGQLPSRVETTSQRNSVVGFSLCKQRTPG